MSVMVLLGLLFFILTCQETPSLEETLNWKKDLLYLKQELPKKHKNLFFKLSKAEFDQAIDQIISNGDTLSALQVGIQLKQLFAQIGDSHSTNSWRGILSRQKRIPIGCFLV